VNFFFPKHFFCVFSIKILIRGKIRGRRKWFKDPFFYWGKARESKIKALIFIILRLPKRKIKIISNKWLNETKKSIILHPQKNTDYYP